MSLIFIQGYKFQFGFQSCINKQEQGYVVLESTWKKLKAYVIYQNLES